LLKRILNTDCVFMKISDIYFSFLIIVKFRDLFNLNNSPKFWIFQRRVFSERAELYLPFFRTTVVGPSLLSLKTQIRIRL